MESNQPVSETNQTPYIPSTISQTQGQDPYWQVWGTLYLASWGNKKALWLVLALFIVQLIMYFSPSLNESPYSTTIYQGAITSIVIISLSIVWNWYKYCRQIVASDINGYVKGTLKPTIKITLPRWISWPIFSIGGGVFLYSLYISLEKALPLGIAKFIEYFLAWMAGFGFGPGFYLMYLAGILAQYKIFHTPGVDKQSLKTYLSKLNASAPKIEH